MYALVAPARRYGVYFGVLGRDCAEVASDRIVSVVVQCGAAHLQVGFKASRARLDCTWRTLRADGWRLTFQSCAACRPRPLAAAGGASSTRPTRAASAGRRCTTFRTWARRCGAAVPRSAGQRTPACPQQSGVGGAMKRCCGPQPKDRQKCRLPVTCCWCAALQHVPRACRAAAAANHCLPGDSVCVCVCVDVHLF